MSNGKVKNGVRAVLDTLTNIITGMGTKFDKGTASTFEAVTTIDRHELEAMYRKNWMSGKVVDIPAEDMVREWRTFSDIEEDDIKEIETFERGIRYQQKICEALKWARLYGGSVILMKVDDGQTPDQPLNLDAIKLGGFKYMAVLDRHDVSCGSTYTTDPMDPNYGRPDKYTVSGTTIHHSRVVRFDGVYMPKDVRDRNDGWGDSVLERIREDIINSTTVNKSIASLFHEASVDVLKIPGLMHIAGDCDQESQLLKRLQLANLSKSIHNMLLLDSNEEYEKKATQISGLNTTIYDYAALVSGGADIPFTRFLGVSPGGLNATGESDLRNYYDGIAADQEANLRDKMEKIDSVMFMSVLGYIPDDAMFEYNPLWRMSDKEQADMENVRADRDTKYKAIIPLSSVLDRIAKDGTYNVDQDFIDEVKAMEGMEVPPTTAPTPPPPVTPEPPKEDSPTEEDVSVE